jgi:hypothetical protein
LSDCPTDGHGRGKFFVKRWERAMARLAPAQTYKFYHEIWCALIPEIPARLDPVP